MQRIHNKLPRIEDVIMAEGIQLSDKGGYYQGLCPFHLDKNPSLVVYKTNNHFYCFGCSTAGDAIAFIQKFKNKTFHESLEYLNIKDFKSMYTKPKPSMIEIISNEEALGIDVKSKYGKEFIDTLIMKYIVKNANNNNKLSTNS